MDKIGFSLNGGLSREQVEAIHKAVLRILAGVGFGCKHKQTIEAVTASKGITHQGGRFRFTPSLVNESIERLRAIGRQRKPRERLEVATAWTCFNVVDMQTNAVRASTAADVVQMLKLAAAFNKSGPPPVYPCDLDERIQVLWLEKACLEHTAGLGGAMVSHDPEAVRWLGELYAAAGKRYVLGLHVVISPLQFDDLALDLLWQFKDHLKIGVRANICPIPIGGMTAPLAPEGLLAQSLAESIGSWIAADRLDMLGENNTLTPDPLPVRVDFGDMRHLTVAYSLPENVMIQVLLRDLAEHFAGYKPDSIYLDTNAKRPDSHAVVDRMAYMLILGLAGYRRFWLGAGQLSMDEIFSPAQFIIDMEIGRYVQRILDGLPWQGDPAQIARTVAEGVEEGNFLTHDTTLDALPTMFESQLFRGTNVGQWRDAGEPTIEGLALARAQEAIDSYSFRLDATAQARLDSVFAEACRAVGVKVARQPLPVGVG